MGHGSKGLVDQIQNKLKIRKDKEKEVVELHKQGAES